MWLCFIILDMLSKVSLFSYYSLSVLCTTLMSAALIVDDNLMCKSIVSNAGGAGGYIRSLAASNNAEASVGFYNYIDQTSAAADDMWVAGQSRWVRCGFFNCNTY